MDQLVGANDSDNIGNVLNLSYTHRMYAFVGCFVLGFLLSIMGTISLWSLNLTGFGFFYTLGNILSLFSTGFLIGFKRQIKNMFARTRVIATLIYLVLLVATLVVAFTFNAPALVILMVVLQFFALVWYSISYIPYARDAIKRFFQ